MFKQLEEIKLDPLIALIGAFKQDGRQEKIDLGVGVYQDDETRTPVMAAVKLAEKQLFQSQASKSYLGMAGDPVFNKLIRSLVLGSELATSTSDRSVSIQTPGGSGALRIAAEVILKAAPNTTIWVSTPTWANHIPLIGGAGLAIKEYPYYDTSRRQVDFDAMVDSLSKVPAGDVVLLHACCHNPSGADLSREQWQVVTELAEKQGFIPWIDSAYQGLGDDLDQDAYGIRLMVERLPEVIVAFSCSKNFGLYRERTGATLLFAETPRDCQVAAQQGMAAARRLYSMPPSHGAAVVTEILQDQTLSNLWQQELEQMRQRITAMRKLLVSRLEEKGCKVDYRFIEQQKGMFSFLGITPDQVGHLREQSAIYMAGSSRINLAGINPTNVDHLATAICKLHQ